ncbi:MAG: hypothetical protein K0U72_08415 [Gammaproteobacteria bacterium]|nr:hypothetical protein [Gammaproteobacteria bacterium]
MFLSACATPTIYGVWEITDTGSGPYYFGHYAFLEDGRKCTVLYEVSGTEVKTTAFLNKWALDDGIITLTYGPNNSSIREGYSSRSRIDEVTETTLTYTIIDSSYAVGDVEVNTRLPDVDANRVCAAVGQLLGFSNPIFSIIGGGS